MESEKRVRRSRAECEELYAKYEQSGLSIAAYSRESGIPTTVLYSLHRRKKSERTEQSQFLRVEPHSASSAEITLRYQGYELTFAPSALPAVLSNLARES